MLIGHENICTWFESPALVTWSEASTLYH